MKRILFASVIWVGVFTMDALALKPGVDYMPGDLIFKLTQEVNLYMDSGVVKTGIDKIDSIAKAFGIESLDTALVRNSKTNTTLFDSLGLGRIYLAKFPDSTDIENLLEKYKESASVEWAEPNYIGYECSVPNDTQYYRQWSLQNNGNQPPEYPAYWGNPGADIDAERAWNFFANDITVTVAVLDRGVSLYHPDLAGKFWRNPGEIANGVDDEGNGYVDDTIGWNFWVGSNNVDESEDCPSNSCTGHGTPIAGIIAATANNTAGLAGINWTCKIMPLKTHQRGSDAEAPVVAATVPALYYATNQGAKVINMSTAFRNYSSSLDQAVSYAHLNNVVLVAAMGNEDSNLTNVWPAAFSNVLAVGATETHDLRVDKNLTADWPPYRPPGVLPSPWGSNYGSHIDIVAPGLDLWTTLAHHKITYDRYHYFAGTSASAPVVAGVAALLLASTDRDNPIFDINSDSIYSILRNSSEDLGASGFDIYYGYGRVNAYQALYALHRGDTDNNGHINLADSIRLLNFIFNQPGGPWDPLPYKGTGDCNCSHTVTLADVVKINAYVLQGGSPPTICYFYNY